MFNRKGLLIVTLVVTASLFLVQAKTKEELLNGCVDFIDNYKTFKRAYVLVLLFLSPECREAVNKIKPIYPIANEYLENGETDLKTKTEYCSRMVPIMAQHEFAMGCLKKISNTARG